VKEVAKGPLARFSPEQRAELAAEYPFASHRMQLAAGDLHYIDEGPREADPLLCVHGNPTWSFTFRHLVRAFRDEHRVVVPDHLGCGLSDKPQRWSYTLAAHVENLEHLVLAQDLRRITLVVHDWGGAIGFGLARRHPERIERLVILNTAAFTSPRIPLRIRVCRTPWLGSFLVRRLNVFAAGAARMALANPEKLSPSARRGLLLPYDSHADRVAVARFVQDIPLRPGDPSWKELRETEAELGRFRALPACIVWGERDWCFTPHFLARWREILPEAEAHVLPDAGHYLLEEAPDEVERHVRDFLARHPLAPLPARRTGTRR
jgi:pimeloyl-ACP methyl ester carboxylesterase